MFSDGGFELSLVFRACFVGALLDRGLGPTGVNRRGAYFSCVFCGCPASQPEPASQSFFEPGVQKFKKNTKLKRKIGPTVWLFIHF